MTNLYFLKAKVTLRVYGISGPFENTHTWLVNAGTVDEAKSKFEERVKTNEKHVGYSSIEFNYIDVVGEIK